MIKILRLSDAKVIGSVVKETHPYEIEFTRQAVLVDKDFFKKLLSRPHLLRGRIGSEEGEATTIEDIQPEDSRFLKAVLQDAPMRGYLALRE